MVVIALLFLLQISLSFADNKVAICHRQLGSSTYDLIKVPANTAMQHLSNSQHDDKLACGGKCCKDNQECEGSACCFSQGTNVGCLSDGDCCGNLLCNLDHGDCVTCFDNTESCSDDSQCCGGICYSIDSTCSPCHEIEGVCSRDAECCNGLSCVDGVCKVPCLKDEESGCTADSQCCNGLCHIIDDPFCGPCSENVGDKCSRDAECCSDTLGCNVEKGECCGEFLKTICSSDEECCPIGQGPFGQIDQAFCEDLNQFLLFRIPGIPHPDGKSCFYCKAPQEDCTDDIQCCSSIDGYFPGPGGKCQSGKCCALGFGEDGFTNCRSSEDCCDPTNYCQLGIGTGVGMVDDFGFCLPCVSPNGDCEQVDSCCDGFSCTAGICTAP